MSYPSAAKAAPLQGETKSGRRVVASLERTITKRIESLLRLKRFVDYDLAALGGGDDFVYGGVSAERDVDDVVAGIDHHVDGSGLIQHALVNGDLSPLGLGVYGNRCLAGLAFTSEQARHLTAHGLDAVDIAQGLQGRRKVETLAEGELAVHGFVEIAGHAHQHEVLTLIDADLCRRFCVHVVPVDVDAGSGWIAFHHQRCHQLREMNLRGRAIR